MSEVETRASRNAKVADRQSRSLSFSESIRQAIFVPRPEMFWIVQGGGLLAWGMCCQRYQKACWKFIRRIWVMGRLSGW